MGKVGEVNVKVKAKSVTSIVDRDLTFGGQRERVGANVRRS